jgi:hypothetical protein
MPQEGPALREQEDSWRGGYRIRVGNKDVNRDSGFEFRKSCVYSKNIRELKPIYFSNLLHKVVDRVAKKESSLLASATHRR